MSDANEPQRLSAATAQKKPQETEQDQPGPSKPKKQVRFADQDNEVAAVAQEQHERPSKAAAFEQDRPPVDLIVEMFPEVDPDFVLKQLNKGIDYATIVEYMASGSYPKLKDRQQSERVRKLRHEFLDRDRFDVNHFLRIHPDPATYYNNRERRTTARYVQHAQVCLFNNYPHLTEDFLRGLLEEHGNLITPTIEFLRQNQHGRSKRENPIEKDHLPKRLQEFPQRRDQNHPIQQHQWPPEFDEEFYREVQYILNMQKITVEIERRKAKRESRVTEAREENMLSTCIICTHDEVLPEEMLNCGQVDDNGLEHHHFCADCLRRHIDAILSDGGYEVNCLYHECKVIIPEHAYRTLINPATLSLLLNRAGRESIRRAALDNEEQCPFCDYTVVNENAEDRVFHCLNPDCSKDSCRDCRRESHIPLRCQEVETDDDTHYRTFIEGRIADAMIRKCPRCDLALLKDSGCNKITCPRCQTTTCYVCRQEIAGDGYEHFSTRSGKCPTWSTLDSVHADVAERAGREAEAEYARLFPSRHVPVASPRQDEAAGKRPDPHSCDGSTGKVNVGDLVDRRGDNVGLPQLNGNPQIDRALQIMANPAGPQLPPEVQRFVRFQRAAYQHLEQQRQQRPQMLQMQNEPGRPHRPIQAGYVQQVIQIPRRAQQEYEGPINQPVQVIRQQQLQQQMQAVHQQQPDAHREPGNQYQLPAIQEPQQHRVLQGVIFPGAPAPGFFRAPQPFGQPEPVQPRYHQDQPGNEPLHNRQPNNYLRTQQPHQAPPLQNYGGQQPVLGNRIVQPEELQPGYQQQQYRLQVVQPVNQRHQHLAPPQLMRPQQQQQPIASGRPQNLEPKQQPMRPIQQQAIPLRNNQEHDYAMQQNHSIQSNPPNAVNQQQPNNHRSEQLPDTAPNTQQPSLALNNDQQQEAAPAELGRPVSEAKKPYGEEMKALQRRLYNHRTEEEARIWSLIWRRAIDSRSQKTEMQRREELVVEKLRNEFAVSIGDLQSVELQLGKLSAPHNSQKQDEARQQLNKKREELLALLQERKTELMSRKAAAAKNIEAITEEVDRSLRHFLVFEEITSKLGALEITTLWNYITSLENLLSDNTRVAEILRHWKRCDGQDRPDIFKIKVELALTCANAYDLKIRIELLRARKQATQTTEAAADDNDDHESPLSDALNHGHPPKVDRLFALHQGDDEGLLCALSVHLEDLRQALIEIDHKHHAAPEQFARWLELEKNLTKAYRAVGVRLNQATGAKIRNGSDQNRNNLMQPREKDHSNAEELPPLSCEIARNEEFCSTDETIVRTLKQEIHAIRQKIGLLSDDKEKHMTDIRQHREEMSADIEKLEMQAREHRNDICKLTQQLDDLEQEIASKRKDMKESISDAEKAADELSQANEQACRDKLHALQTALRVYTKKDKNQTSNTLGKRKLEPQSATAATAGMQAVEQAEADEELRAAVEEYNTAKRKKQENIVSAAQNGENNEHVASASTGTSADKKMNQVAKKQTTHSF